VELRGIASKSEENIDDATQRRWLEFVSSSRNILNASGAWKINIEKYFVRRGKKNLATSS